LTGASGVAAAKLRVPHNGLTSQRRSLLPARVPVSSPSNPSLGRAAEMMRWIASSAARSASVAKSVGHFASWSRSAPYRLLTAAAPAAAADATSTSDCSFVIGGGVLLVRGLVHRLRPRAARSGGARTPCVVASVPCRGSGAG
jgi:hypothetical protein